MSRVELTQFSVESNRVKLKIWVTQLESSWKCKQFDSILIQVQNVNSKLNLMISLVLKLQFAECFQMKDLDSIEWYLEMHITRDKAEWTLWINQSIYIKRVIELLSMSDCSSTKTSMHHKCQLKKNVYWKFKKWVKYQAISEEIKSYQSIIETLMWIVCQTWSNIVYAVSKCSRY